MPTPPSRRPPGPPPTSAPFLQPQQDALRALEQAQRALEDGRRPLPILDEHVAALRGQLLSVEAEAYGLSRADKIALATGKLAARERALQGEAERHAAALTDLIVTHPRWTLRIAARRAALDDARQHLRTLADVHRLLPARQRMADLVAQRAAVAGRVAGLAREVDRLHGVAARTIVKAVLASNLGLTYGDRLNRDFEIESAETPAIGGRPVQGTTGWNVKRLGLGVFREIVRAHLVSRRKAARRQGLTQADQVLVRELSVTWKTPFLYSEAQVEALHRYLAMNFAGLRVKVSLQANRDPRAPLLRVAITPTFGLWDLVDLTKVTSVLDPRLGAFDGALRALAGTREGDIRYWVHEVLENWPDYDVVAWSE